MSLDKTHDVKNKIGGFSFFCLYPDVSHLHVTWIDCIWVENPGEPEFQLNNPWEQNLHS